MPAMIGKVSEEMEEEIDDLVENNRFESRSEFIYEACLAYLRNVEGRDVE